VTSPTAASGPSCRRLATCLLLALLLAVAGCAGGATGSASESTTTTATLTVLAASSLTGATAALATAYRATHPGIRLRFSLAGSQELASQVRQGAPADVIVTADERTMNGLRSFVGPSTLVASNRLAIVVRPGNPRKVRGLRDLPGVLTVLAGPEVPAGRYARAALVKAAVTVHPASEEPDVRSVLTRVRLGEADAGIVYVTDAAAAGKDVDTVDIPLAQNVSVRYPAAVILSGTHQAQARGLVRWLGSGAGFRVLSASGFAHP
jgi:molybdate transport system substrate-binding protein